MIDVALAYSTRERERTVLDMKIQRSEMRADRVGNTEFA
jgi:hypothetical protein